MKILLTGGLGYIGSHIAHLLGEKAVIIDNQINSSLNYKKYLPKATVYKTNLNFISSSNIFKNHKIKGVIHLAGLKAVNESMNNSLKYYKNNINSTIGLLEAMDKYKINKIIFSSSATVYGDKNKSPLKEDMTLGSINPYGSTKIIIEQLLSDYAKSNVSFKAISLRYFNPLGGDVKAGLFEQPLGDPQNIMPILLRAIAEKKTFKIFGKDYPTKDGTCIRDYIHVKDLARAHILAFQKLDKINDHISINLGLGKGLSVLNFIKMFEKSNHIKVDFKVVERRSGDVDISFADNTKAKKILGWSPKYSYTNMMRDSWVSFINKSKI